MSPGGYIREETHYTESSYGLYKGDHHILVLTGRTWYIAWSASSTPFPAIALEDCAVASQIWTDPAIVKWSELILNSFRHWTKRELLDPVGDPGYQAHALFRSPFVVVSHGIEEDPLLNYGNQVALELWELTWERLVKTPSRLTAEPVNRAEREWMLEQVRTRGYLDTYRGVRISSTGRRFFVESAIVWNVMDAEGQRVGQAATFSQWTWLIEDGENGK